MSRVARPLVRRHWIPLEKEVEGACDRLMAILGFKIIRFSQARETRQTEGIPDRKYYRGRYTLWLEAKRPGGKQRKDQKKFQRYAENAGEVYVLGGLEALTNQLQQLGLIAPTYKDTWTPTQLLHAEPFYHPHE